MCKTELVIKSDDPNGINQINKGAIDKSINDANTILEDKFNK